MKIKNIIFSIYLIFIHILYTESQTITLTFNGTPEIPEQVIIENLSNNTSTTLIGTNVLNLTSVSIFEVDKNNYKIFPNPFIDNTNISFNINESKKINILIYNQLGQLIITKTKFLHRGENIINFIPEKSGIYLIKIFAENFYQSSSVICEKSTHKNPELSFSVVNQRKNTETKSTDDITFTFGDILKFTGIYSNHSSIITDSPTSSTTYNFEFLSCIDFENNNYPIVKIGSQWWMAENLKSTKYSNGTNISGSYIYDNNSANEDIYGRLYKWDAVMNGAEGTNDNPSNVQGVCPTGWHIPSEIEWDEMRDALGGWEIMHGKLKETGTIHWFAPNNDATNESGMTVLPGGIRFEDGDSQYLGEQAFFWTSTDDLFGTDIENASGYTLFKELPSASYYIYTWNLKTRAQSVRCVMD